MKPPKTMWCVMRAHGWENLSVNMLGCMTLTAPKEGPHFFMPVFITREQAIKWAGSEESIVQIQTVE